MRDLQPMRQPARPPSGLIRLPERPVSASMTALQLFNQELAFESRRPRITPSHSLMRGSNMQMLMRENATLQVLKLGWGRALGAGVTIAWEPA